MRGASALQKVLDGAGDRNVRILIVWEPVILSDVGPPTSAVLSLVSDERAVQFWDKTRSVSEWMVRSALKDPSLVAPGDSVTPDTIVWDVVAIYRPTMTWSAHPLPLYYGGPVVDVLDEVRSTLAASRVSD